MTSAGNVRSQSGFTLIELLVVILILAILAAIAIPAFLGQREKGYDATSKQDARNLASLMEACYRQVQGYTGCAAQLAAGNHGIPYGPNPGQAQVTIEQPQGYQIVGYSRATDGGPHTFTITHNIGGVFQFSCLPVGRGGCRDTGTW